jgi:Peptidase family M1 domain
MNSRGWQIAGASSVAILASSLGLSTPALAAAGPSAAAGAACSSGSHSLSPYGAHVYPDTGNGGYTSIHTDVHVAYDAVSNRFLPGNHVVLDDRAAQCLRDFSLDFERRSANRVAGPDMVVHSVTVDGVPARFHFVQPTYPGDPHGQGDPNPMAHEVSQLNPVGGPDHNPLPPACSPELTSTNPAHMNSQNGQQCPANKLVIVPQLPIPAGSRFTVTVSYTGRPGVHNDGDGTTEGWFRAVGGSFVTTEPVATEDWMPLNDYPTAKPSYDFFDTVNAGKQAVCNGVLVSSRRNAPDVNFPAGSVTWHWRSTAPVASYLVENSIGNYHITTRTTAGGVPYYEVQDSSIGAAQQAHNLAIMQQQEDITDFESLFNGPYPFMSDGILIGTPNASFAEEMQTMITFPGGQIDRRTLYHENMHQWWGDNVSEGGYNLTFFKEGFATVGEYLMLARDAETAAGGPQSPAGRAAFDRTLVKLFNQTYASAGSFWTAAPSNPTPFGLFSGAATYSRPAAAYLALRQILGPTNFTGAMQQLQREYGGGSITEAQLEAGFNRWMPSPSAACSVRLHEFFSEWFDTAYNPGGGESRPAITGPGLVGPGFYGGHSGCRQAAGTG